MSYWYPQHPYYHYYPYATPQYYQSPYLSIDHQYRQNGQNGYNEENRERMDHQDQMIELGSKVTDRSHNPQSQYNYRTQHNMHNIAPHHYNLPYQPYPYHSYPPYPYHYPPHPTTTQHHNYHHYHPPHNKNNYQLHGQQEEKITKNHQLLQSRTELNENQEEEVIQFERFREEHTAKIEHRAKIEHKAQITDSFKIEDVMVQDLDGLSDISINLSEESLQTTQLTQPTALLMPTQADITRILQLLQQAYPTLHPSSILCSLNHTFSPTKPHNHPKPPPSHTIPSPPTTSITPDPPHTTQTELYIRRHRFKRQIKGQLDYTQSASYRQQIQRRIAHIFITKGYGLALTRQNLQQNISCSLYNSLLTSVLRIAVRKLCDIVIYHLHVEVSAFDAKDQIQLRSPLANCRQWLSNPCLATFFTIISQIYHLPHQHQHHHQHQDGQYQVWPSQLVNLYNNICIKLSNPARPPTIQNQYKYNNSTMINLTSIRRDTHYAHGQQQQHPLKTKYGRGGQEGEGRRRKVREGWMYQRDVVQMYVRRNSIQDITENINHKYNTNSTQQDIQQVIQNMTRKGLNTLLTLYHSLKKHPIHSTSLINFTLAPSTIQHLAKDNTPFKCVLLGQLIELNPQNLHKINTTIERIQEYLMKQGIEDRRKDEGNDLNVSI